MFLENYVLDVIGELEPERAAKIGPLIQKVFGGGEDWKATLRAQLHLNESIETDFIRLWSLNKQIASEQGQELHPVQFAKMIADKNFVPNIDPIVHSKPWWKRLWK